MNITTTTSVSQPVVERVQMSLDMSLEEAQRLCLIMAKIGGRLEDGRQVSEDILVALKEAGANWLIDINGHDHYAATLSGSMSFESKNPTLF